MKRVTGIGGIFFNAKDPVALRAWYMTHLGIEVQEWGGAAFRWTDESGKPTPGTTIWSIGDADGDYFAPSKASFMINYRVADLHGVLQALRTEAATCSRKQTTPSTGNSAGSLIRRATKSNSGSLLRGNESPASSNTKPPPNPALNRTGQYSTSTWRASTARRSA